MDELSIDRPKNLLVFINPFGGRGKAVKTFNKIVVPIFNLAEIKYQVMRFLLLELNLNALVKLYE